MVDLIMLNMHGTNNSTAMTCFPTTSHSVQGKRAVTYINFVSIDVDPLIELISLNLFIIFVTDLEETQ